MSQEITKSLAELKKLARMFDAVNTIASEITSVRSLEQRKHALEAEAKQKREVLAEIEDKLSDAEQAYSAYEGLDERLDKHKAELERLTAAVQKKQDELAEVSARAERILSGANDVAARTTKEAEATADRVLRDADEQASKLVATAKAKADKILAEAEAKAAKIAEAESQLREIQSRLLEEK